jgi:hypothetical protein
VKSGSLTAILHAGPFTRSRYSVTARATVQALSQFTLANVVTSIDMVDRSPKDRARDRRFLTASTPDPLTRSARFTLRSIVSEAKTTKVGSTN